MTLSIATAGRLRRYASFVRFEHTLFSLPLIVAGVFVVGGPPLGASRWVVAAIAAVAARTLALALNRMIDRRLDALNPRTRERELPAGRMGLGEAWLLLVASAVAYLAACSWLGALYLRLAPIPLVVFVAYPYLKRFTSLCHLGVGAALALAPLAGYAVAHPDFTDPAAALWLGGFALAWVSGFDIIYATLDEDFDRGHGVHSAVVRLGRPRALRLSAALHGVAFLCLAVAAAAILRRAPQPPLWTLPAVAGTLGVAGLLLFLEPRWAENVDLAFFKVNVVVGFAVLAVVLLARTAGGF
jgi:4-hydroxybenzoate polyprenyltransferase